MHVLGFIAKDVHHSVGQVAVEDVTGRQLNNLPRIGVLLDLKRRAAHRDAGCLGFITTGNDATVVVREHNDLFPVKPWVKHPLTGNKEVIAIDKPVHLFS